MFYLLSPVFGPAHPAERICNFRRSAFLRGAVAA
jgi:hypothetical protein